MLSLSALGCASDSSATSEAGTEGETLEETETEGETAPDSDTNAEESPFPVPTDEVDYNACESGVVADPECVGIDCADADYQDEIAVLLEVVEEMGLGDVFKVSRVDGYADTDQLFINYLVHIGWFRTNDTIQLWLPLSEDELRESFETQLGLLDIPDEIAPLETVRTAISECFGFEFDPCEHNWPDFKIHVSQEGATECSDIKVAIVDLQTGETIACREESVSCG